MPRQDVPYGGAICRLKERIAEIWDKLDQKLHSINGVEGDGAGNVEISSGNAAVVITNDQIGHKIEVSLDSSKLPAASVSSVNGQTGAVRLDAVNILSYGDSNVQADIDWYKQRINECFDSIATEQDDRQNADATLQTNINAVKASIPEMSTTPDPYKGVERDAQGRAFAADPAAGATDKTLVTANWVSQTGDNGPNNLAHKNGSETINGDKRFTKLLIGRGTGQYYTNFWLQNMSIDRSIYDGTRREIQISFRDMNNVPLGALMLVRKTASTEIVARVFRQDGTYVDTTLIDEQGRAFAADPAADATDKTLVTANWVSQTGDSAPNNLIHKSGNEAKSGRLTMKTDRVDFGWPNIDMLNPTNYSARGITQTEDVNNNIFYREELSCDTPGNSKAWMIHALDSDGNDVKATLLLTAFRDGTVRLELVRPSGTVEIVPRG